MNNPYAFVLKLQTLSEDLDKISRLMRKYSSDQRASGMSMFPHSFDIYSAEVALFKSNLERLIDTEADKQGRDVFYNKYQGFGTYKYVELIFDFSYSSIATIRLLNKERPDDLVSDSEREKQRYVIWNTINIFSPSVVRIISDLKKLSASITYDYGDSNGIKCGDIPVENSLNRTDSSGITSTISWIDFANQYFIPKPIITPTTSITLSKEDVKNLASKYNEKSIKTEEEVKREEYELSSGRLKLGIAQSRDGSYDVVNTGNILFGNIEQIKARIEGEMTTNALSALEKGYSEIFNRFDLGCLLKSAAECVIPPMNCRDILRGFRVSEIPELLNRAFPNQPRTIELFNQKIEELTAQNQGSALEIDQVLDAIELFIDLEALCDLNFNIKIPTVSLPNLDIIDLFGSVSIEIDNSILEALVEAIIRMILGILDDLLDCDNLDKFIAALLDGGLSGLGNEVAEVFGNSINNRVEQFSEDAAKALKEPLALNATVGANLLNDSIEIRESIHTAFGLSGISDAIKNGDFNYIKLRNLTSEEMSIKLKPLNLINSIKVQSPAGQDLTKTKELLAEIGRFELSSDGESFSLRRISDDHVVELVRTIGQSSQSGSLSVSGANLKECISKSLKGSVSVLMPSETLRLLSGKANEKTKKLVRETSKNICPELYKDNLIDPVMLFSSLGKSSGLDKLEDKIILLSNNSRIKDVPRAYCPEDDDRFRLREQLLSKTLTPEQVKAEIDKIINAQRQRYNNIAKILAKKSYTPTEVLENIKCSTGIQPNGVRPKIIDDSLNMSIGTMFDPVKMAFDKEVLRYVDAVSLNKKKTKTIPRKVSGETKVPILNPAALGGGQPLFQDLSLPAGEKVNPEWKKLISNGFTPTKEDGSEEDPGEQKDYRNGAPIEVQELQRVTAGLFKSGLKFTGNEFSTREENSEFNIRMKGSIDGSSLNDIKIGQSNLNLSANIESPSWTIDYRESGENYSVEIEAKGSVTSLTYGSIPFSSNYSFDGKISQEDTELLQKIRSLSLNIGQQFSKKEIYSSLNFKNINSYLTFSSEQEKTKIRNHFELTHGKLLKTYIDNVTNILLDNRLLKTVPNKSLKSYQTGIDNDFTILSLINFSPAQTKEQKQCGKDPHLLDLEKIKNDVKQVFDKSCGEESSYDGLSPTKSPLNKSAYYGAILTTIRLYCIEYMLRGLIIYDELEYSEEIVQEDLIVDFISNRMVDDLKRIQFYDKIKKELSSVYDKFITYFPEDKKLSDKEKIKSITRQTLKEVNKKLSRIVGKTKKTNIKLQDKFINSLNVYDTFSDFKFITEDQNYTSHFSRFGNEVDIDKDNFILEKYLIIPETDNLTISSEQNNPFLKNVVNFKNAEEMCQRILDNDAISSANSLLGQTDVQSLFGNIKIGMRISLLSKKISNNVQNVTNSSLFKKFVHSNDEVVSLNETFLKEKVGYCFDTIETFVPTQETNKYCEFNCIPVCSVEMPTNFTSLEQITVDNLEELYSSKKQELFTRLQNEDDYKILFDYCLISKKLPELLTIYTSLAVNSDEMINLFNGTKKALSDLFDNLSNMGDYTHKTQHDLDGGNTAEHIASINKIGGTGGPNPNALLYMATAPILILKGLLELTDPNIAIASKIIQAGEAGFFSPKFKRDENNNVITDENGVPVLEVDQNGNNIYPGEKISLPYNLVSNALLPLDTFGAFLPAPFCGPPRTPLAQYFLALEPLLWKLPFFQNNKSKTDDADEIKKQYGLDLSAAQTCTDEEE